METRKVEYSRLIYREDVTPVDSHNVEGVTYYVPYDRCVSTHGGSGYAPETRWSREKDNMLICGFCGAYIKNPHLRDVGMRQRKRYAKNKEYDSLWTFVSDFFIFAQLGNRYDR